MSHQIVKSIAIISTTLLVALISLMVWGWTQDEETPPRSIYSVVLDCPEGTLEYTNLGNGGEWIAWYRTCVQNHGPLYVWRDENLVSKGSFVNGKRHGDFTEFDDDGKVVRTTKYVDGQPVQQ